MKALVYTGPRRVELQELPQPTVKPKEALVRIRAAGVCGSDVHGFLGKNKKRVPPLVLGHEFSGEIIQVGKEISNFRVGDRVAVYPLVTCGQCRYCKTNRQHICPKRKLYGLDFHGALAEYVSAPEPCLFRMPTGMGFSDGALVEPLANAIHVVEKCLPIKNQTGVIYGAGSIGLLIFWIARHLGASRLAIVDINARRLETLKKMGADLVIDASAQRPVDAILRWTDGQGAEFTIDAVGNQTCRENAVACTAAGGISTWIGLEADPFELSGFDIVRREIEIKGSYAYSMKDFVSAMSLLEQKLLPTEQFVQEAQLERGQDIFNELADRHCSLTKVIFTI